MKPGISSLALTNGNNWEWHRKLDLTAISSQSILTKINVWHLWTKNTLDRSYHLNKVSQKWEEKDRKGLGKGFGNTTTLIETQWTVMRLRWKYRVGILESLVGHKRYTMTDVSGGKRSEQVKTFSIPVARNSSRHPPGRVFINLNAADGLWGNCVWETVSE